MESKIQSIVISLILAFVILGRAGISTVFLNVFLQGEGGCTEAMHGSEGMIGEDGIKEDTAVNIGDTETEEVKTIDKQ